MRLAGSGEGAVDEVGGEEVCHSVGCGEQDTEAGGSGVLSLTVSVAR